MEKSQTTNKSKNKILWFLPKAAVSFQNPIFSPGKDKRSDGTNAKKGKTHFNRGSPGLIMSIIPAEARTGKSKNSQEPTSPKISCMGQIKHKKKLCRNKCVSLAKEIEPIIKLIGPPPELKKKPSTVLNILSSTVKPERRKSDVSVDQCNKPSILDRAPTISQMKRFSSTRDSHTLVNFDWRTAKSEGEKYEEIIPLSAPLLVAGSGLACGGVA